MSRLQTSNTQSNSTGGQRAACHCTHTHTRHNLQRNPFHLADESGAKIGVGAQVTQKGAEAAVLKMRSSQNLSRLPSGTTLWLELGREVQRHLIRIKGSRLSLSPPCHPCLSPAPPPQQGGARSDFYREVVFTLEIARRKKLTFMERHTHGPKRPLRLGEVILATQHSTAEVWQSWDTNPGSETHTCAPAPIR